MASRLGSPNKDKQALREWAAKHGVDVVEIQLMIAADLKKTCNNEITKPRSRRSKRFFEAEDKLIKVCQELTPYVQGKLSNVTVTDETPRLTVIRGPETIGDSQAWLSKFGPARNDAANDRPALPFVKSVRAALEIADGLDEPISAQAVLDTAKKHQG